jgi:hypothetical protein
MDLVFECQKAVFSALHTVMPGVRIEDKISDDEDYPYICLEDTKSGPHNTHDYKGKSIFFIFGIYTKPAPGEGTYEAKTLLSQMCDALELKKLTLTLPAKMRICQFDSSTEISNKEIKSIQAIFNVIAHEQ